MSRGMSPELIKKETDGTTPPLKALEQKGSEQELRRTRRPKAIAEAGKR